MEERGLMTYIYSVPFPPPNAAWTDPFPLNGFLIELEELVAAVGVVVRLISGSSSESEDNFNRGISCYSERLLRY